MTNNKRQKAEHREVMTIRPRLCACPITLLMAMTERLVCPKGAGPRRAAIIGSAPKRPRATHTCTTKETEEESK